MENWREAGFGLYIHWPFCEAKCPYCDFNSHVSDAVDHDEWREALLTDLRHQAKAVPDRVLGSIFFGGGTPSRMAPDTVAALIAEARRLWPTTNDVEVTLEANPTSVEADKFTAFARAGINRVSVGVQALRPDALRKLGRTHDVHQAMAALAIARQTFDRVSFDLIYARQDQSLEEWRGELDDALALQPDHLSLYQLTIEPGTVFARRAAADRLPGLPKDEQIEDMYLETNDILSEAGLPAYEVSNHAKPGSESRHNLTYWRAGDWLGVGPGAHGRFGDGEHRRGTASERQPQTWLSLVKQSSSGVIETETSTSGDHAEEYLMTGLRLAEGIDLSRLDRLGLHAEARILSPLVDDGLAVINGDRLRPTLTGRALTDSLASYLATKSIRTRDRASQS